MKQPLFRPYEFIPQHELQLAAHNRRMDRGCLVCHSAAPGRVCPDCYVCIACSPGCDECAPTRQQRGG